MKEKLKSKREMKINFGLDKVFGQFFIFPSISVTYTTELNGSYEVSLWFLFWTAYIEFTVND